MEQLNIPMALPDGIPHPQNIHTLFEAHHNVFYFIQNILIDYRHKIIQLYMGKIKKIKSGYLYGDYNPLFETACVHRFV